MMLKPFRIRSLYDSSPAVVQLTTVQYDSTIKSQPEAALSYLDDDDGETILVGSSLELEQRLDEHVPSRIVRGRSTSSAAEQVDSSMHTFDIKQSSASLATWREHEAYTSKALRKSPLKSSSSSEPPAILATPAREVVPSPAPHRPTDVPLSLEDAIKGALQGLETHVEAFAGFLQDTSATLRTVAGDTRDADLSAVGGILDGFKGIFSEVGKVGKAMVEAFDTKAFPQSPSVSQALVEDSTLTMPAAEDRALDGRSSSNVVEIAGSPDKVLPRSSPLANVAEPFSSPATPLKSLKALLTDHEVLKRLEMTFEGGEKVDTSTSAHARGREPAPKVEGSSARKPNLAFAAYASLKDPWNINSETRPNRDTSCNHCQMRKTSCNRYFSGGACHTCLIEKKPCSFIAEPTSVEPPRSAREDQMYEDRGLEPSSRATQAHCPPQQLNLQQNDQVQLPRETAKTYTQPPKAASSRSILDLENSDPDFSTRYPPLMSLRKSKTISSLADRSRSPFLANMNPEAAISRFPSLSQIEHEARSERRLESTGEAPDTSSRRWSLVKDSQDSQQAPTRPKLIIPRRHVADAAPATPPKLPGAWPEPKPEAEGPTLPTSEESSGAFFDRMTRSRSPEPATRSFRYIPAHLRQAHTSGTQYMPRHLREPLIVDTTNLPRHLRHSTSVDTMAPQLGRSKTVTASNPAARLTRPFDPLEDARQPRDSNGLPRRSGTERYRRRPYNDSFTGAGRMPWESFEHVSQPEHLVAARHDPRPSRQESKPFSTTNPSFGIGISDKVADCVTQLRDMGYGNRSPHEASRLSIYAAACNGDIVDALEMIEEDRKAGRQHKNVGDRLGVRPFNHNERPTFGR